VTVTTATQAAQDMLERLNRAAALFSGASGDTERGTEVNPQEGIGEK
jgi:hypothetical protein